MSNSTDIDISTDCNYTSLFETDFDVKIVKDLFTFYLYKIANSSDSPLSMRLDVILDNSQKDLLFNKLLIDANISDNDILFSNFLRNEIKTIKAMELSDTTLKCDRVKGFFHQNLSKKNNAQHKLDAMFKHIRDSFAHGRIALATPFLILEDKRNELTGRFVVTIDILQKWKVSIEEFMLRIDELGEK